MNEYNQQYTKADRFFDNGLRSLINFFDTIWAQFLAGLNVNDLPDRETADNKK